MQRTLYLTGLIVFLFFCLLTNAQNEVIKGKVKDDKGPIAGASILVKGSGTGTSTDANGNFTIIASVGNTLIISSTGYATQEIEVGKQTEISITLLTDSKALEGVVVIGYGTKKKQNLTGAVTTVSPEVFQSRP